MNNEQFPISAERMRSSPEVRGVAIVEVASALHENWREPRLLEDGTYEPDYETTKDVLWIGAHKTDQVDIANNDFHNLPLDWQEENIAAAGVVVELIDEYNGIPDLSDPVVYSYGGNKVHGAWCVRHPEEARGPLGKGFDQLSEEEQRKDIQQIEVGISVFTRKQDVVLAA